MAYVVAWIVARVRAEGLASYLGTSLGGMLHVLASAFGLSRFVVPQEPLAPLLLGNICAALSTLVDMVAVLGRTRL